MSLPFRIVPIQKEEVLRRSAMSNPSPEEEQWLAECCREGERALEYRITERNRPLDIVEDEELKGRFQGCDSVVVFTARLGASFQALLQEREEPEKDILYRGLAAERMDALIESYLDHKEKILQAGGGALTPHYAYAWDGVEENEVTATRIAGISFHPEDMPLSRCRACFVDNCPYRREEAGS